MPFTPRGRLEEEGETRLEQRVQELRPLLEPGALREHLRSGLEQPPSEVEMLLMELGWTSKARVSLRPQLLRLLESPWVEERHKAALELDPGAQSPASLEALLDAARTGRGQHVRKGALLRLRELGPPAEAVPRVLEVLKAEEEETTRLCAVNALEPLAPTHPEAADALLLAVKDPGEGVSWAAARALGQRGAATEALVPRMIAALEAPELAEEAAAELGLALGKLGAGAAVPALVRMLERPDRTLRRKDFGACGPYLVLKVQAVRGLEALGPLAAEAVPVLLETLRRSTGQLQIEAARALAAIGTVNAQLEEVLCTVAPSAEEPGRTMLLDTLAGLKPLQDASLKALVRALGTKPVQGQHGARARSPRSQRGARARILEALGGREEVIERLQAFAREEEPELSGAASEVLATLGRPTEQWRQVLAQRLESPDQEERDAAIQELRTQGPRAGSVLPGLLERLPQLEAEARAAVLSVLGPLSGGRLDEALFEALTAGLGDGEPHVREAALWALCDFTREDAGPTRLARALLEDSQPAVREAAKRVLRSGESAGAEPSPAAEDNPSGQASAAIGALAYGFYRVLREGEGNRVFSPLSLFTLLAMVLRGARDHTEAALSQALHWPGPPASVSVALRGLLGQLQKASPHIKEGSEGFALVSANGLFAQNGYPVRAEYLAELAEAFGLMAQTVDFAGAPAAAIAAMNAWAREQTQGHIPELVQALSPDTRCVLANAVYFRSAWMEPFEVERTRPAPFSLLDGQRVEVPMMSHDGFFGYTRGAGYQLIKLRYQDGQTSMVVLLPDAGFFERFEALLSTEWIDGLLEGSKRDKFVLKLPRFSFDQGVELSRLAQRLGLSALLARDVDLSGMISVREPLQAELRHDARITVDEKGTVAAAIASMVLTLSVPREVEVNRPFLFLIRHEPTGTVLFLGRVTDPRSH